MAKEQISQYDATAGNNSDINTINISEGCAPSNINNALREIMAHLKDLQAGNKTGQAIAIASGGTGAENATDARTNLSVAKSGANSDITSLSGLTTVFTTTQGGHGKTLSKDIGSVARSSEISTITTDTAHGFAVNDTVTVTATTNTGFNGTFTIDTVPTSTTFTYEQTGASDVSPVVDTGTAVIANFIDANSDISGILPVNHGGIGANTLTENSVLLGNGTSAPLEVAPSDSGNVLTSDGTTWASTAIPSQISVTFKTVTAGDFVVGDTYEIVTVGTTDFTAIGASENTVGIKFVATDVGSGTGTAYSYDLGKITFPNYPLSFIYGYFISTGDGEETVTFHTSFSTSCFYVSTDYRNDTTGLALSKTGFDFNRTDGISGSPKITYFAIGF
jgi:hypothetical protein